MHQFRFAGAGALKKYGEWRPSANQVRQDNAGERPQANRQMRGSTLQFRAFKPTGPFAEVDLPSVVVNGTPALDFSDVLILHLGFIGDDLVVALDANLSQFL